MFNISKIKSCDTSNLKHEEKLDSFDIAPSFKNRQSRSDAVLECDRASNWRMPVPLTALCDETKYSCIRFEGTCKIARVKMLLLKLLADFLYIEETDST